jgi:hypothetical protein
MLSVQNRVEQEPPGAGFLQKRLAGQRARFVVLQPGRADRVGVPIDDVVAATVPAEQVDRRSRRIDIDVEAAERIGAERSKRVSSGAKALRWMPA